MSEEEVHRSVAERSSANAREVKYMPDNIDLNKKGENIIYVLTMVPYLKYVFVLSSRDQLYTFMISCFKL